MNGINFLYQARSLDTKLLWVKELREVIQQFQFGTLQERSKCIVTIDFLYMCLFEVGAYSRPGAY